MKLKDLTEQQKEFIKEFFHHPEYAGWENIADKLLEFGECVVAGSDCIWIGGIGNFIDVEESPLFIGCVNYRFLFNDFLSSSYFQDYKTNKLIELEKEEFLLRNKINNIYSL